MVPQWAKIDALEGGTEAMRAAGPVYLPQHAEESDPAYGERLQDNVLFNQFLITLESLVGRPFSDPIQRSEDMPETVDELLEDIDLQGNNLGVFCRHWFRTGMAKAFAHVLIDAPRGTPAEELGRPRSVADDKAEGIRPYWIAVRPENLISSAATIVNGREVLMHARILEVVTERVGFAEQRVEQIREFNAGGLQPDGSIGQTTVTVWRRIPEERRRKGEPEWQIRENLALEISFIPLVTFYAEREDFMCGRPPLMDLADLNIRWWQSNSDQINVLTVARFPMLGVSGGGGDDDKVVIGPHQLLSVSDPQGQFYYIEHTGTAIAAGRQDLNDLREMMAEYGAQFLKRRPGSATATARALDTAEATSPLQDMTLRFVDAVNEAIAMTGVMMGLGADEAGSIAISTKFDLTMDQTTDLNALTEARRLGDISRQTYLAELRNRNVLSDDFDAEENDAQLKAEPPKTPAPEPKPALGASA
jgi:hypothetical protein